MDECCEKQIHFGFKQLDICYQITLNANQSDFIQALLSKYSKARHSLEELKLIGSRNSFKRDNAVLLFLAQTDPRKALPKACVNQSCRQSDCHH
ncbi:hypothetical protein CDAR_9511 [Caerostris darwini]|uniref:Uncharacterized protein n=1 Tax=Caerostris darwini TaxID=1538125 RepID=A0AAV4TMW7_9ARAC|nr:hypothetical protein CDAR_9511 [Caerostris darwini]